MLRLKIIPLLFGIASLAQAQQVTLATPSLMQFTDPPYGVAFRYPAKWTFSVNSSFYATTSITSTNNPARGVVFVKASEGFNPYPNTNFDGAEFVYANRKSSSTAQCSASLHGNGEKILAAKTIGSINYVHAQASDAGMCHQTQEDLYATYRNQTCYLFDLAVHTICPGVKDNSRALTTTELAQLQSTLEKILSSVEISDLKKN